MAADFTEEVIKVIKKVPHGRVATYGQIATLAGNYRAARQVVRILHTSSDKEKLNWHRIINRAGKIALKPGHGYEQQKAMLEKEGIIFGLEDKISLKKYQWKPGK